MPYLTETTGLARKECDTASMSRKRDEHCEDISVLLCVVVMMRLVGDATILYCSFLEAQLHHHHEEEQGEEEEEEKAEAIILPSPHQKDPSQTPP